MSQIRNNWSIAEDKILKEFVQTHNCKKWTKIAQAIQERIGIKDRTGKQCRERWNNNLNPGIKKRRLSKAEENKIFELQVLFGNKWSEIASHLPGRTDNSIKNCFYSTIRRKLRRYNKKKPENEKLKGSLKNLLKCPASQAILMSKNYLEKFCEVVEPIKIEKTYLNDFNMPNDIIRPCVSPLWPLQIFETNVTNSTTTSVLSSGFSFECFSFNDEGKFFDSDFMVVGNERSETSMKKNFLPSFCLEDCFEYYFIMRNYGFN